MRNYGRRLLGLVVAFLIAIVASAATYNFTTTTKQDKKLHKFLVTYNAKRVAAGQSELTTAEFWVELIKADIFGKKWRKKCRRLIRQNKTQNELDALVGVE
jgi:hypothetical protein